MELFLLIISLLFFASIFFERIGNRFGMPALLVFLLVGMFFGQEGLDVHVDNIEQAEAIATVAMCIILFTGGLNTKFEDIRPVIGPGASLATIGVIVTCLITGIVIMLVYIPFEGVTVPLSLSLLGAATLSSTDSAAVFSILRNQNFRLKHHLRETLELESGANDPMAFVLVITLIDVCTHAQTELSTLQIVQTMVVQLVVGLAIGIASGYLLIWLMKKVNLTNMSLYPQMILSACIFIFGATYYMKGNSYLAVYVGGLIIGNYHFTRKRQTRAFFDGLTWMAQLLLFLMLGMMVQPSDFLNLEVWLPSLIIVLALLFLARPIAVFVSLLPFLKKYNGKDMALLSWFGLKGAVPIVFAIICKANEVPYADTIFNVVFLCSLISLSLKGATCGRVARQLGLASPATELKRLYHFDLDLPEEIQSSVTEVCVSESMVQNGNTLKDMHLPNKTLVIMVNREDSYFVPTGNSELQEGDNLLIITDDDATLAQQMIEQQQKSENSDWHHQLIQHPTSFIKGKASEFMNHE